LDGTNWSLNREGPTQPGILFFSEALLGTVITVPSLGFSSNTGENGNIYVTIQVIYPSTFSESELALLNTLFK
jgi:DnaJ-class molecular chaperone